MTDHDLETVRVNALSLGRAEVARDQAIVKAHGTGRSLREIGEAAGLSHEQVRRIIRRAEA